MAGAAGITPKLIGLSGLHIRGSYLTRFGWLALPVSFLAVRIRLAPSCVFHLEAMD